MSTYILKKRSPAFLQFISRASTTIFRINRLKSLTFDIYLHWTLEPIFQKKCSLIKLRHFIIPSVKLPDMCLARHERWFFSKWKDFRSIFTLGLQILNDGKIAKLSLTKRFCITLLVHSDTLELDACMRINLLSQLFVQMYFCQST